MEDVMGRPIGSINRQRPFNDALLMTLRGNPLALRRIAAKLVEKAEEGDLAAIREVADRLDGKPAQVIDRRDLPINGKRQAAAVQVLKCQGMRASIWEIGQPRAIRSRV